MRLIAIDGQQAHEVGGPEALGPGLAAGSYLWISCTRVEFEAQRESVQALLQTLCGATLVDLHVSDLLNRQLPSRHDYTSRYDLLVFRRLAAGHSDRDAPQVEGPRPRRPGRGGPPVLRRIDTSPVGFAVFDTVLLTVHPADCAVREGFATRLLAVAEVTADGPESRNAGARVPAGPADMMLRMLNLMVDAFLELRRELTHQLDHWQAELLDPASRFNNWSALLDARLSLHRLDEICEDQRSALQDWLEAVQTWPDAGSVAGRTAQELLQIRSRDVLEHIERVVHHVRRLEQSVETAVQMHFNAQSHRTNEIMRTLTVLTAIFLPLNLIAGIFGMNFEFIPWLHRGNGFWLAMAMMGLTGAGLMYWFWRRRYLDVSGR